MTTALLERLKEEKIVAILRGVPKEKACNIAEALCCGGIVFTEVTMNTKGAIDMISGWREKFGERMKIGAGTVLDLEEAKEAVRAGAEYLVSPNLDEKVVDFARSNNIGVFPGAMTPTEIVRAWKAGATAVKVFPMATLGVGYLKEIRASLNHIPMIATGGVRLDNIHGFMEAGATAVGIGGYLVHSALVREGRYETIKQNAVDLVRAVKSWKSGGVD
ncbi:2-dehydro-3-deoxyphosphogluconate aldolase/(4S)-4-hydroxy-2-oxoglutarate aldolase [Fontibacillus phaseoli]|uniref:2-dehydro-3-deoxyphosphogluconate aldolase/(4S)-4-hydroxy-2-oxoglutarate aldolase n=1 Tax=Fontibacillus phaseoli TaxID=1416533 RepID=A0A369B665_9BACL|nr:bifunctional 4-hydroxy-2-oxoglutarate aldolase/2-dehydro-3-deoxy-phosphogluconate aldolase [Fontibacillus phaseoli]RCX17000.1 2-dehydro-3-deoxyphosphogluconate aldolase/(4S)-4-hydroxy-2-oxoglutarate aldolase [Fontibacillus phaseoli]